MIISSTKIDLIFVKKLILFKRYLFWRINFLQKRANCKT